MGAQIRSSRVDQCQLVQRSVGATDAMARTPSLISVVQSCSSAGRHNAQVAATQWLQRDSVGLAIVKSSSSRCIYAEHLFKFWDVFQLQCISSVSSGSASKNTNATLERGL